MICAIVLAAGRSSRMGTQKLLLPFAGETMVGHIVDEVLKGPIGRVLVITGPDHDAVADALAGRDVLMARNPDAGADMLSSVRCGIRALPPGCEAILVVLGDQPSITAGLIDAMVRAQRDGHVSIVVPVYRGRRGHPILFNSQYAAEVLSGFDGVGLRGLLVAHPNQVVEMEVEGPGVVEDIDTPADYRDALKDRGGG